MTMENLFNQGLRIINIGLFDFYETLINLGVECRQVDIAISETGSDSSDEA